MVSCLFSQSSGSRIHKHVSKALTVAIRSVLLGAAIGIAMAPPSAIAQTSASTASKNYSIPAGPLADTLTRFAAEAGVMLSFDPQPLATLQSSGLRGTYSVRDGFAELLRNSGYELVDKGEGAFSLKVAPPQSQTETTLKPVSVRASLETENATGPVQGFVARRSATATKTDTPLLETPQSISVVTADRIAAIGATTLRDALAYTPGVNVAPFGPDSRFESTWFFLRGFDIYNPGGYMDGLPLRNNYSWAVWQNENYGVERVDILRGPSSVLYGQASPGGTVNVVSKRPSREPIRELELQVGSDERFQIAGDLSGPIDSEGQWLYRVTAVVREAEYPVDGIDNDRLYIAPALTWTPSDRTSITLLSHYLRGRAGVYSRVVLEQGSLVRNPDGSRAPDTFIGDPDFDRQDQDQWAIGYLFEHQLNDRWTVRQNVRYGQIDTRLDEVFKPSGYVTVNPADETDPANYRLVDRSAFGSDEKAKVLTLDNQLQGQLQQGRFDNTWLVGIDYQRSTFDQSSYYGDAEAPLDLYAPVYGQPIAIPGPYFDGSSHLEQTGVYAQLQSKFADRIAVTLGARYDTAKGNSTNFGEKDGQDDDQLTTRAGIVYLSPTGLAPYFSYSESFYPESTENPETGEIFEPETARQYEVGVRYQPAGINATYSAAAFDLRRQNYVTTDAVTQLPRQTGEVTVRGLELEAIVEPLPALRLTASYAWTPKAEVSDSSDPEELGLNINGVSEHLGSLWADYRFGQGFKAGLGVRYVGSNDGNYDSAAATVPSYTLVDAMLGYIAKSWEVTVNATNLTDKTYFASCGSGFCYYGDERRVGATLTYHW